MKHKGLFRPKYKDKDGTTKESSVWWIRFTCRGCSKHLFGPGQHRESTDTESITDAKRKLASKAGSAADGKVISAKAERTTMNQLFQLVVNDYRNNGQKTLPEVEMRMKLHLTPFFAGRPAQSVRTSDIEAYKTKRLEEEAAPATINRELAIIGRAFSLGVEQDLIINQFCKIKKFKEDNARTGFITDEQLETLCSHLPADISPAVRFAFETGWRTNSEVLTREWRHVDFEAGKVRLEPGETKNGDGREFPLTPALFAILQDQKLIHEALAKEQDVICPYAFHSNGSPLVTRDKRGQCKPSNYFRDSWTSACTEAKLAGKIPHDLRRVAVSRFERIGITRKVGMQLSGHLTESIYRRYHVVQQQDLDEAALKLSAASKSQLSVVKSGAQN